MSEGEVGVDITNRPKTVADFFAGIGLVSLGLDHAGWKTVYALDYDDLKAKQYAHNFDGSHYHTKDIGQEKGSNVPAVTLAHASFPCTDLSLAGARRGIHQGESSAFWEFARIIKEMQNSHGEANPPFILLENVEGLLTSNNGMDLRAVLEELNALGYRVDLLRINATHFVPQSRVRIFIVGIHKTLVDGLNTNSLIQQEFNLRSTDARPKKILDYIAKHMDIDWYFHRLPNLPSRKITLESIIDSTAEWWPEERTAYLYNQLHDHQKLILEEYRTSPTYRYFSGFRRMRKRNGINQSTVELRNDNIAGCLRTPKGGSARQIVVRAGKGRIDARLYNSLEAARLMGAFEFTHPESTTLNQALFGFGDAVCVQALEWIGNNYLNDMMLDSTPSLVERDAELDNQFTFASTQDQIAIS